MTPTADLDIVDGSAMRQRIEPIAEPGEYRIEYKALSADDGLVIDAAYLFTYDPEAQPPVAIPLPDEGGLDPDFLTGTIGTVVLAGVIGVVASRRRRAGTSPRPGTVSPGR